MPDRRCQCGQRWLQIAVTNHIDVIGDAHNDGITWRRDESSKAHGQST
jgi:hypothetical protein